MKHSDIADTEIFIRDTTVTQNIIFQKTIPYFKRVLEINSAKDFDTKLKNDVSYQICLLAKDSKNVVRHFYQEQCKDLSSTFSAANSISNGHNVYITVVLVICKYLF